MTGLDPHSTAADWLVALDATFADALSRVSDDDFTQPTALPGWTTAHLVAHVHFNALALCRLVGWARTGVEASMYASAQQRAEEIASGATLAPTELRALVAESAQRFLDEFGSLDDDQSQRIVVTAQGRSIPAAELAWLRCRELGVHTVDLGVGTAFGDLPSGFVAALVHEIVGKRLAGGEGAALAEQLTGRATSPLGAWL
jgi:maleylpyruvate isomerase